MNSDGIEALSAAVKDLKSHIGRYRASIRIIWIKAAGYFTETGSEALGLNLRK